VPTKTQQNQDTKYDYTYADAWMPNEGEVIEGTILTIDTGASAYGPYPIVTIRPDGGDEPQAVHCFHQAIRGQLARVQPKVGDPIGIKYLGRKKSTANPNQSYAVYRVISEGAGGYDWSRDNPDAVPAEVDADTPPY
jgi:hypothetical protein